MKKPIYLTLSILGWLALTILLYLRTTTSELNALESTLRYFSYFTVLTNLLVTLYCTSYLLNPTPNSNSIFAKPETLTALTVYIIIVGIVYHIALKPFWNPKGLTMACSETLHTLVPIGTLILWIVSSKKDLVNFKKLLRWLLYPGIYVSVVLIQGSFSGFYPYPFLDVKIIGLQKVLTNCFALFIFMLTLMLLLNYVRKKIVANTI